ncbi:hypothetical protein DXG01_012110, partial [Tephrocybe rancida]
MEQCRTTRSSADAPAMTPVHTRTMMNNTRQGPPIHPIDNRMHPQNNDHPSNMTPTMSPPPNDTDEAKTALTLTTWA